MSMNYIVSHHDGHGGEGASIVEAGNHIDAEKKIKEMFPNHAVLSVWNGQIISFKQQDGTWISFLLFSTIMDFDFDIKSKRFFERP